MQQQQQQVAMLVEDDGNKRLDKQNDNEKQFIVTRAMLQDVISTHVEIILEAKFADVVSVCVVCFVLFVW